MLLLISSQQINSQDFRLFNNIQNSPSNNVFFVQGSEIYSYATMDNPLSVTQPLIAPASVGAQSGITRLWKNSQGINIGEVSNFQYYDNMNPPFIPSNVNTSVNQPVQAGKYYIFKIRTNQNADSFGLLMEFGGIPYAPVDCRDNVLGETVINSPVTITLRTEHNVVEGQYFYIRYRHSNDPDGVYQWGQFSFNNANSRFGQFIIPGHSSPGTVSYKIYCKGKSISSFSDTSYTSDIYNVANYENNYSYEVKNSLNDRVNTTFLINMQGQTLTDDGVYLDINANNKDSYCKLSLVSGSIYSVTIATPKNKNHAFRFFNGSNGREQLETPPCLSPFRNYYVNQQASSTPIYCYNSCINNCIGSENNVNITFRVDMSNTFSSEPVYLESNINSSPILMTAIGNGIHQITLSLIPNSNIVYRFKQGLFQSEITRKVCSVVYLNNRYRFLRVPNVNQVLNLVCFNECSTCNATPVATATLRVNMTGQNINPLGVYVAGTFNNWSTTANPMTFVGNGIYETEVQMNANQFHEYKFLNGTTYETLSQSQCPSQLLNGNRYQFVDLDESYGTPCFGQCVEECGSPSNLVDVTFRVNMTGQVVSPNGIRLAGSFNGFSTSANPMTSIGNNIYETTLSLTSGTSISYKFVNGTSFEIVPISCGINDGNGNINRTLSVPNSNTILTTVCFNTCDNSCTAASCNAPSDLNVTNITSNSALLTWTVTNPTPTNGYDVFYNTTGNPPTSSTTPLDTSPNPFEGINNLIPNTVYYYWVRSNCGASTSNWVQAATPFTTNVFSFCNSADYGLFPTATFTPTCSGSTEIIATNAWASEYSNVNVIANKQYTFSSSVSTDFITITNQAGTEVIVSGQSPLNWYTNTFNGVVRYYIHTNSNCGNAQVNRTKRIACNNPTTAAVLFNVNMSNQTVSPSGVKLAGNFNGWSTTANPMTAQANGIYSVLITLPVGSVLQYKFVNGNNYEIVPNSCGVNDGNNNINRFFLVNNNGVTSLPIVCFNECGNCQTLSNTAFERENITIYPNPVKAGQTITISLFEDDTIKLFDLTGKLIAEKKVTVANPTFDIGSVSAGVYILRSKTGMAKIAIF